MKRKLKMNNVVRIMLEMWLFQIIAFAMLCIGDYRSEYLNTSDLFGITVFVFPISILVFYLLSWRKVIVNSRKPILKFFIGIGLWSATHFVEGFLTYLWFNSPYWIIEQDTVGWDNFLNGIEYVLHPILNYIVCIGVVLAYELLRFMKWLLDKIMEPHYAKHPDLKEIVSYLIIGVLTTAVSWLTKYIMNEVCFGGNWYPTHMQNVVLSVGSWMTGVIFAYFANRKYVFISNEPMAKEACKFVLCRVSTCVMDVIMMQILTAIRMDLMSATFLSTVVVTICNYLLSKVFVFARKASAKKSGDL